MPRRLVIPSPESVGPDTPLRLDQAAAVAYPYGGMTAAGLRAEGKAGRLIIERVRGKDYTTLAEIKRMREKCRVGGEGRGSGSGRNAGTQPAASPILPPGISSIEVGKRALEEALTSLRKQNRR
jgi:hypothetical protein